jgi:hypothetical protein
MIFAFCWPLDSILLSEIVAKRERSNLLKGCLVGYLSKTGTSFFLCINTQVDVALVFTKSPLEGPESGKRYSLCIEVLAVLTPFVHSLLKLYKHLMYINRVHSQLREETKSADKQH